MVQGTSSGAGKSLLAAALCRIYARRGLRVLPFKAQNMSNNAAVTPCGGEIGRAQALQARAAGVEPRPAMNPVLLKPLADTRSEVIVLGRRDAELTALPWRERGTRLWEVVARSLAELRAKADLVVIEGAGSPAEINLPDVVNMRVAAEAGAPVLLVADIDRGGAFAALYGTWALLPEGDRARIAGFVLNKFRGDASLLSPAPEILLDRTGVPTLGVVPWLRLDLPDEDAASLGGRGEGAVDIAAIHLPHVSNFDDLDPLAAEPGVRVRWVDRPEALDGCAAVVIPGTRNTTGDLRWLWSSGLAARIRALAAAGTPVVGLCGGYQMLGLSVSDPLALEGGGEVPGLGLLDAITELAGGKTTRRAAARWTGSPPFEALEGRTSEGYEIHHGRTLLSPSVDPLLEIDGEPGGASRGEVWGCYLHGVFADDAVRAAWLTRVRSTLSLPSTLSTESHPSSQVVAGSDDSTASGSAGATPLRWDAHVERELDRLADAVEAALDFAAIDRVVGLPSAVGA
jgi:adenosylcobyric acid synthase